MTETHKNLIKRIHSNKLLYHLCDNNIILSKNLQLFSTLDYQLDFRPNTY